MDLGTRIAVVGGGLGGLTAAGLLQRQGHAVTVYEQAESFSRIGAGIILSANPVKVLQRLGLEPGLVARGIKPDAYVRRRGAQRGAGSLPGPQIPSFQPPGALRKKVGTLFEGRVAGRQTFGSGRKT
jgi:2-polyprenyl-6-methoxyphenol hydroxylase-like FAD-dependent oxidoreductase